MDHLFQVHGMTCGHCEMTIKKAIARIDPQAKTSIDRSAGKVEVNSEKTYQVIANAISQEGYQVL